jgi:hypothetical protein
MMDLAEIKEWMVTSERSLEGGYTAMAFNWLIAEVGRLGMEVHSRTIGERDANDVISRQAGMLGELRARCERLTARCNELDTELAGVSAGRAAAELLSMSASRLGQEDMRERAAKTCDARSAEWDNFPIHGAAGVEARSTEAKGCAIDIRALPIKEAALSPGRESR